MSQGKGRIQLYLADIRPLYKENIWQRAYAYVDEERRRRADACKLPQAAAASLAAGVLARYALQQNGLERGSLSYGEKGQPLPEVPKDGPRLWLSLSHSGDYAVCAVSDRPVGVDIQRKVPIRLGMLRHFFPGEEGEAFLRRYGIEKSDGTEVPGFLPEAAAEEFLRLWTVKESYMKLTGAGMGMGFAQISADLAHGTAQAAGKTEKPCRIRQYRAPEGYFLSACISEAEP